MERPHRPELPELSCAAGYRPLARERLDAAVWAHLCEGEDLDREEASAAVLGGYRILPRPLADVAGGHTRLSLFGDALGHPLLVAPLAYQRLFHVDGEAGTALAAVVQGGQSVLSSLSSQPFEAVAAAAREGGGPPPWFQLYWQGGHGERSPGARAPDAKGPPDRGLSPARQQARSRTARLLDRAAAAGCRVVVFTVDAPIKRATTRLPADVRAVNLDEADAAPAVAPADSAVFDHWMAAAPSWDDLAWLRQRTPLPLLVKGVLHPDDALRAVQAGCDGVVVSSHGGRVLAAAPPAIAALPQVVACLTAAGFGDRPVLFDSGIRSGADAFVALALGARAVLVGRPVLWGLAAAGVVGVAHVLRLLRDELEMTMALAGCRTLADIDRRALV